MIPVSDVFHPQKTGINYRISCDAARLLLGKTVIWENEFHKNTGLPEIGVFIGFWSEKMIPVDYPSEFYDALEFPFYINVDGLIIHASNIQPLED